MIDRLTSSFFHICDHGDDLATRFYGELFEKYPAVRRMFPQDMAAQKQKLIDTLEWVVVNLKNPKAVQSALAELGARHQAYGAAATHYPLVRDSLLHQMGAVSGEQWSQTLENDWRTALDLISRHMLAAYKPE
ncbi:MAG: globin domain-containing protein [Tepidisphaeraceae bacterium]